MNRFLLFLAMISCESVAMDIQGAGFSSSQKPEVRRAIKAKYNTRTGYLYEYKEGEYYSLASSGGAIGHYKLNDPDHKMESWRVNPWPHLDFPPEIRFTPGISGYDL
ncbi:hypothetical protein, partial [Bacterioplanes sanyensis]|uniref:hypothetical protein n=1 Tax=Bacterioplanes sanyensis TaxID=1249553 RepID=UPI0016732306